MYGFSQTIIERTADVVSGSSAPYYVSYSDASSKLDITFTASSSYKILRINLLYPCNKVDFKATTQKFIVWGESSFIVKATTTGNWDDTQTIHNQNYKGENQAGSQELDPAYTKVSFESDLSANNKEYVKDIKFTIAPHIIINTESLNYGDVDLGSSKKMNIEFKSFYNANGELKIIGNTNSEVFRIKNSKIADAGKLKQIGTNDYATEVEFWPNSAGQHTATITISDGQITKTVTLSGNGINKTIDQTIVWEQEFAANLTIGDSVALNATATSGLDITYASSNEAVANIKGNYLHIVGVGSANITASQAGNDTFNHATEVVKAISIAKINQTIAWEQEFAPELTIGDSIALNATATSGLAITYASSNEAVAKVVDNFLYIVGVGEANISAAQAGNDTFNPATDVIKAISIAKLNQTIAWEQEFAPELTIGDSLALNATATSGLAITYASSNETVANIKGNYLHIVGVGSANITASQAGNDIYNAAEEVTLSIYIKKIEVNVENTKTSKIVYANGTIYFEETHSELRVYDMTGRMVYSANVKDTKEHRLALTQRGIYIIYLDKQSLKIVK